METKIKNIIAKNFFLLFRFGLSGLFFNLIGFIFYVYLSNYFNPIISLLISYPIIIICYFYIQNFYVFTMQKLKIQNLIKFFLNSFFLLFSIFFLLLITTEIFFFDHKVSQFLIMIFLIIINFTVQKKIIFRQKNE